ncbi:carboxylating nicotinate-nucleotide diphosphorylase [Methylovorus glucosotrophus]|uniref:Probable nicotinate-nucleotide pyrophosphorylase [carboxylating] n=1 Tax=Methylovorus glucosotrophus (strain SIP3-4) TaxID=582744 RepID=C6X9N9_METGS|nr:carboxylating nicotinate-nucleotide diphosphorylase [Methylovorus glucosotrophus]ACT49859.1 nicotinate-nucleotide pyrophosphorylase [Methylovorus glucosotrophus SIP3-4]
MTTTLSVPLLSPELQSAIQRNIEAAIAEDIASGDLTASLVPADQHAHATLISREPAILCGIPWVEACFARLAPQARLQWQISEGAEVTAGQTLCIITGNARQILTAERCALNFLQTLSATATVTARYVQAVQGTKARILDTRKTLPGLRMAQKYAVTVGGGMNQRMGLYDGILIKENHIAAAGSIAAVMQAAIKLSSHASLQIEVESLAQLEEALAAGAELILLDNFDLAGMREAVALTAGRAILEASGGVELDTVRAIAETGVDRISIGGLTKHVHAIDLSLRFQD